jgi:hypothetical protein
VALEPDDLYGLPLERFTQERNALAKRLRKGGRREEASEVAKLRKPSVAAWAVNQLVRTQKRELAALFKAGDRLVKVQTDLLAKRSRPGSLRQALDDEREAVAVLVERARGLLSTGGAELSGQRLEQVSETLHAAALDDAARAQVRPGSLDRELRHIGLGALGGGSSAPAKPAAEQQAKKLAARTQAARKAAARQADQAQRRRRRAETRLREAEAAVTTAREARDQAVRDHELAERRLQDLTA